MNRLTTRERVLVVVGGLICLLAAGWLWWGQPALKELASLDKSIGQARENLSQLAEKVGRWQGITARTKSLVNRVGERSSGFSLVRHLEDLVKESGLQSNLTNLRPLPPEEVPGGAIRETADIKLDRAPMAGLVKLIYRIEYAAEPLTLTRLALTAEQTGLNASLRVLALKRAGK